MKKHFLFLATLVLGFGQLFADQVTFSIADLRATLPSNNTKVEVPYTWKVSPYHVSVTIAKKDGTTGTLSIANPTTLTNYTLTVTVAGAGTLDGITVTAPTGLNALEASTGTYTSGTWTPEGTTSTVTFTPTSNFRLTQIAVDYTPDSGYTPDVPVDPTGDPLVGPFEATPIVNFASYKGTDPYVFDMASRKYYAYNSLGEYEEFGLYPEVSTLKVAGGGTTEIEYIATLESVGTHPYINTNYIPKANTKIVMDVDIANSEAKNWMAVFGARQGGWTSHAFVLFARAWGNQKGCFNRTGDEHAADSDIPRDQRMTIEALGKTCTFTLAGETDPALTITTKEESTVEDCTNNLFIFDTNTAGAGGNQRDNSYVYMKLYGCKIYEGETLVKDYVPVVDAEGHGGLKDKLTGTIILSASSENFELSPDGQAIASEAGISVYPGKLVVNTADQHEYNWNGTKWVDLGSVYKLIDDTNYQNMNNWTCRFGYSSTYDNIENEGNDNYFNPYKGEGGWEPYQYKLTGLTKGETYKVSFNFTSEGWTSWDNGRWAALPVFVTNNWNFPQNDFYPTAVGGQILGFTTLPKAAVTNQLYSFTFTADDTEATLAINFGVVDDAPEYHFRFDNLTIEFVDYPQKYDIFWKNDYTYTPLAYIESTTAARENPFTTPYFANASTEVDIKFYTYAPDNGDWRAIFSGRNGSDANTGISLYRNGNGKNFGYFVGGYRKDDHAPYPGDGLNITVKASMASLNVDGTDYPTGRTTFNPSSRPISLFANPEWDHPYNGRIYYFTIKENGETIYDFRPVMRDDNVFGFYDAASETFLIPAKGIFDGYGYSETSVAFNAESRIIIVGNTAKYMPEVINIVDPSFTWTSSDESIASVADDGTVTGKKGGNVTITATEAGGMTASYVLTVSEPEYKRKDVNNVGYAIITGGNGWGDSPVANLVDNDATTKFGCSGGGDAWAIIIASEPVAVQQYSFVTGGDTYGNPGRTPRDWKLEGSNDNQTWTVIDQQEQNYKAKTANKEQTVFTVNGTDTYKFFKFTAGNFNGGFQLGELWINEQAHTWGEPTETASTCTVEGKKVWECTDCKALKTERLPLAAHTYENGVCTVCNAKVAEPILLANGQANDYIVKFRHKTGENNDRNIEEGWNTADFDDSAWDELVMPIGTAGYGVQHTIWQNDYNTFWFRRNFYVENPAAITKLTLKALHDDDYAIYVNGTQIDEAGGWTNGTEWLELNVDPSLLVAGNNVVAVYIEQNWGGAYCDFYLEGKAGATVEVGDAGYATFVAPCDVDFTGSEAAAKAATFDGTYVQLADVTTVPAGTAVVVKAEEGTYTVPATTNAVLGATNELVAATADVATDGKQYILAKAEEVVGFYKATGTIAAGKGYLVISGDAGVKGFYPFAADDATGINEVNGQWSMINGQPIYNLAGQRIQKIQKGINIVGGKKILK